jgi:signal transduction protein with GAF and PtsI domain
MAGAAWAQTPPTPPVDAVKTYLGLTDTQIQALQQIQRQEAEALRTIHEEMQQKHQALAQQLQGGSTDAAALGRLLLDIQNLRKRIEDAQKNSQAQALNQLTTDQKTKLKALEDAAKLREAIEQATGLNLLIPPTPQPGAGPGGPGMGPGMGPGPRGPGMGPMGFRSRARG